MLAILGLLINDLQRLGQVERLLQQVYGVVVTCTAPVSTA
jgi:hypothetical protein